MNPKRGADLEEEKGVQPTYSVMEKEKFAAFYEEKTRDKLGSDLSSNMTLEYDTEKFEVFLAALENILPNTRHLEVRYITKHCEGFRRLLQNFFPYKVDNFICGYGSVPSDFSFYAPQILGLRGNINEQLFLSQFA